MTGRVVLITGGNSGIGLETVRDLTKRGAYILMASRRVDHAMQIRGSLTVSIQISSNTINFWLSFSDQIVEEIGNAEIEVFKLDLSSKKSIREFARTIVDRHKHIDVLIHNSGCASTSVKKVSVDGIEMTMATNHYGPFLLTHLLIDLLKASKQPRIVIVSSAYYKIARVDLKNLNPLDGYPMYLYYVSKTANMMFGLELSRRLRNSRISVYLTNPGMCNTSIFRKVPFPLNLLVKHSFKTASEGAQTTIMCAVSRTLDNTTGEYFSDCKRENVMDFVKNEQNNLLFWEESVRMVNLTEHDPRI